MSSVIQNLLDKTIGDGARSTKFDCLIFFQYTDLYKDSYEIFTNVKTSQFPGKSHEVINLKFKGRNIPIKGQVKYNNTWSCTFYLTEDHKLKNAFENWIESLDQHHNMKPVTSDVNNAQKFYSTEAGYATTLKIKQNDFAGTQDTVIYELFKCFPISVSSVDVDYSDVGKILEYTVEFSYAYFNSYVQKISKDSFADELDKIQEEMFETVDSSKQSAAEKMSEVSQDFKNSLGNL